MPLKIFIAVSLLAISSLTWRLSKTPKVHLKAEDWTKIARSLTGESEVVRQRAIENLRAIKNLDQILAHELHEPALQNGKLNTKRFLALDVITALDLKSMMPVLVTESLSDPTGYSYHTMNTLMTEKEVEPMARLYRDRLLLYPSTPAAKLALLDTLGRIGFELSLTEIHYLKNNASIEVQSGILAYLRELMILRNRLHYQMVIPEFMIADSVEVKMQALYLLEELSKKKINFKETGLRCDPSQEKTILNFCKKILDISS